MVICRCEDCGESKHFEDSHQAKRHGWTEDDLGWCCPECSDDCEDHKEDSDEDNDDFNFASSSGGFGFGGFGGGSFGGGGGKF